MERAAGKPPKTERTKARVLEEPDSYNIQHSPTRPQLNIKPHTKFMRTRLRYDTYFGITGQ